MTKNLLVLAALFCFSALINPAKAQFGIAIASKGPAAGAGALGVAGGAPAPPAATGWQAVGGAFLYPFKWRPSSGAIEKSFGLTAAVGPGYTYSNDVTVALLANIGSSSVQVDPEDVKAGLLTDKQDMGAVTFAISGLCTWKIVQFGVSVGIDKLFDEKKYRWTYDGKPWVSFGIGIFTKS